MINFINSYKFSNANHDDLWRILTEEAQEENSLDKNITVKGIMDLWTLQGGYPLVKVEREYSTGKVKLSQV